MAIYEKPRPASGYFHKSFGPSLGHSVSKPFSVETPSRLGPRHCGQSAAVSVDTNANIVTNAANRVMKMPQGDRRWCGGNHSSVHWEGRSIPESILAS